MTSTSSGLGVNVLVCAALLSGCGGSDSTAGESTGGKDGGGETPSSGNGTASGTMHAKIDGMAWEATARSVRTRNTKVPGGYTLEGTDASGKLISLELYFIDAKGDFAFGVDASVVGARASYAIGTMVWLTPSNGDAGKLAISALSDEHIAGTFEFEVVPVPGSPATGMHQVSEGEFDIDLKAPAEPIAADVGRSFSADLNEAHFNAATVVVSKLDGGISFNALNDNYNIGFYFAEVDAPGKYELAHSPARNVVVVMGTRGDAKTQCCWGTIVGDSGSLELTTFSDDRLAGSFEFMLGPQNMTGASSPLVATKGMFDIGRAEP